MNIKDYLKKNIEKALNKAGFDVSLLPAFSISPSKQKDHGDLSTNLALILASRTKKNPREIAQAIISELNVDNELIPRIEVAGPGFINFSIGPDYYHQKLKDILTQGILFFISV